VSFIRQCRKIWWSQRSHKLRHNMVHTRCTQDKQGYMHAGHEHAQAPGRTHVITHTHRQIYNTYCFSSATKIHEHSSMLRYTHTACLIISSYYSTGCGSRGSSVFLKQPKNWNHVPNPPSATPHHPIGQLQALWRPISAHTFPYKIPPFTLLSFLPTTSEPWLRV
jgi:hypothetical protein